MNGNSFRIENIRVIQAYRGLAACSVVAYHLSTAIGDQRYAGHNILQSLTWRMDIGVDFFFVLSGFIIFLAHEKDIGQPQRLADFLKKRFARIFPAYWIYVGVYLAFVGLGFAANASLPTSVSHWSTTFALIRFGNFDLPIAPAWTLIHEVAFYAVFSIVIFNLYAGVLLFLGWQLVCLALFQYPEVHNRTSFFVYFSMYNFDFFLGIACLLDI